MLFHNKKGNKSHIFHWLMMALCCLIPVALIFILPRFNITSGGTNGILTLGLILLCPLMHLFMMKGMHGAAQEVEAKDENAQDRKSCH